MNVLVYAAAAGLTTLVFYLLIVGKRILLPFVIAVFVSYFVKAAANAVARVKVFGRPLPRSVRYGVSFIALLLLGRLIVDLVVSNAGQVMTVAPTYEQNLLRLANRYTVWAGLEELTDIRVLFAGINLTGLIRSFTFGLTSLVGSLGTIGIYTVFLLLEHHQFEKKIAALFPDSDRQTLVRRILRRIGQEIQAYIWLKTLFSLATTAASYVVMKAVGLDMAGFWALLIFALNFIPYIGAWLGVIFPALIALVQFESPSPFFAVTALLALIQFTGGSVIEPRVMGIGLNVSPVVMLLSLSLWGSIWGVVGMFLSVPIMVVVIIVCSHFAATRPLAVLLSGDGQLRT